MKYLILFSAVMCALSKAKPDQSDPEEDKTDEVVQIFTAKPKANFTVNPHAAPQHSTRGHHKGLVKSYQDCFGMTPEFHGKDKHCIFPFIYRGIVYETCTYVADTQPWCATATDVNGHLVSNDWGYCTAECPVMPHTHCRTVEGGPIEGAFCRFPFRYKDVEYNMCTRVDHSLTPDAVEAGVNSTQGWCATKVDAHGDYVPHHWGICQHECRPPKTEEPTIMVATTPILPVSTSNTTVATISVTSSGANITTSPLTTLDEIITSVSRPQESTSVTLVTSESSSATTSTPADVTSASTTEFGNTPGGGNPATPTPTSTPTSSPTTSTSTSTSSMPPQHIVADQLPIYNDRATYIPKAYSDPIGMILKAKGIEFTAEKQEL